MSIITDPQPQINTPTRSRLLRTCQLKVFVQLYDSLTWKEHEVDIYQSDKGNGDMWGKCPCCEKGHLLIPVGADKVSCDSCDYVGFLPHKKRA